MNFILKKCTIAALPPIMPTRLLAARSVGGGTAAAADLSDALYHPDDLTVKISQFRDKLAVSHSGEEITILRHQDPANTIAASYATTPHACPPICWSLNSTHSAIARSGISAAPRPW